jgi:hypothetical protein
LLRKLREAEIYLRSLPAYAGMTPVALGRALGLDRSSAAYSGGRISAKRESMHGMGLALDIDAAGNPWVGAGWIKGHDEQYRFAQVLRSAAQQPSNIPAKGSKIASFLHAVAVAHGRDTRIAYDILALRNEEFKTFLRNHPSELHYWTTSATFGKRNPLDGFLNLHVDLVVALRQKALLAWGAIDFGDSASGDIMHFDLRTLGIGREIATLYPKPRPYIPKSGHHPVSNASPPISPGSSQPGASKPGVAASIASLPRVLAEAVRSGALTLQAVSRIIAGERDVDTLTNLVFYARHSNLPPGYKIKPQEKGLAREWLEIRDRIVRPVLRGMAP